MIIKVGGSIGIGPTIFLLLVDSILGSLLLRSQGRSAWVALNRAIAESRLPAKEVLDGVLIIFGGALLLTPGFLTDIVGLFLLIPPTRAIVRGFMRRFVVGRFSARPTGRDVGLRPGPGRPGRMAAAPGGPNRDRGRPRGRSPSAAGGAPGGSDVRRVRLARARARPAPGRHRGHRPRGRRRGRAAARPDPREDERKANATTRDEAPSPDELRFVLGFSDESSPDRRAGVVARRARRRAAGAGRRARASPSASVTADGDVRPGRGRIGGRQASIEAGAATQSIHSAGDPAQAGSPTRPRHARRSSLAEGEPCLLRGTPDHAGTATRRRAPSLLRHLQRPASGDGA